MMLKSRRYEGTKSEDLILQDAMLRSMVDDCTPRSEFKEALRMRLAHGSYYEPGLDGGDGGSPRGMLATFLGSVSKVSGLRRLSPAVRFAGLVCIYVLPLLLALAVSPLLSRDTSLSVIAAEVRSVLGTRGSLYYEVKDSYVNRCSRERIDKLWKVWRAASGSLYIERFDGDSPSQRSARFYSGPNAEVLLDDRAGSVKETRYDRPVAEADRRAITDLSAPLVGGGEFPVISGFTRRPVSVQYTGRQEVAGRVCKTYSSGDGIRVWADTAGSGYLRIEDVTGATADPDVVGGEGREWSHTLEVSAVRRDGLISEAVFVPSIPDGYRAMGSREVFSSLSNAKTNLGFMENLPGELWETFEKPRAYVVAWGGADAELQVVLFRKGQNRDPLSAIHLSQWRPAPRATPVHGYVTDPDQPLREVEPEFGTGATYTWACNGTYFRGSVRASGEHTQPNISQACKAIREMAQFLPRM